MNIWSLYARLSGSTVVWSWLLNGLRLAGGILLLPLLLHVLSEPDLGMYYVFLNLSALIPIIDFGFSVNIARNVSYAMGGATELISHGVSPQQTNPKPNYSLLWQLLYTTRHVYAYLSLAALIVLGLFGSLMVSTRIHETNSAKLTWLAWGITLVAAIWEIYAGWWNVFLQGMDRVLLSTRVAVLAQLVKLVLAGGLLVMGGGLLSWPVASLIASVLQRRLARHYTLKFLGPPETRSKKEIKELLKTLWPNCWRLGLYFLSGYFKTNANAFVCLQIFGLPATAVYGLSFQLISFIQSISAVWTAVKWPLAAQCRIRQNYTGLQNLMQPRVWLQFVTFIFLAVFAIFLIPDLFRWFGIKKSVLPSGWLALLALNAALEMHFSFWTTLLSMENKTPFLWPTILTNIFSLLLVLSLVQPLGLIAVVISPLIAGSLFNYWFWPLEGAKTLQTTWFQFTFLWKRILSVKIKS